jgi:hypothetical protein
MPLKDNTTNSNQIETKLAALGLKIPERLKVLPDVKTPSTRVRIRGDKPTSQSWTTKSRWLYCRTDLER